MATTHRTPNEIQRVPPRHSQRDSQALSQRPSHSHSQSSQPLHSRVSPSTASTVSPQIPSSSTASGTSHAVDHDGFPIPSHSLRQRKVTPPNVRGSIHKPTAGGPGGLGISATSSSGHCNKTGSQSIKPVSNGSGGGSTSNLPSNGTSKLNSKLSSNLSSTVSVSTKPNTSSTSSTLSTKSKASNLRNGSNGSYEWLRRANSSRVLSRNEIESVVNHSMLTGYDREVAEKRIQSISSRIEMPETRKWAGLCKYDHPDRIMEMIEALEKKKKALLQEMIQLIRKPANCKSDDDKKRQEILKDEQQAMIVLLNEYREMTKRARAIQQSQSGKSLSNSSHQSHPHSQSQHQSQSRNPTVTASTNSYGTGGGGGGPSKASSHSILAPNHHGHHCHGVQGGAGSVAPFYAFGRSADKFDYSLNPEFCAAFRGHMMSHDEFEHFSTLRAIDHEDTMSNEAGEGLIGCAFPSGSAARDLRGNSSLLGAASGAPPSIDVINIFRDKTNEHQKTLIENLKTLYGDDWRKYVGSDGKYTAHLLSQYQMDKLLGNGVYGYVFKAKTKKTNHTVAIKALQLVCTGKQKQIQDDHQRKLREQDRNDICPYIMNECIPVPVIREIMCLKMMNHENITKLYDIVLNDPLQCASLSPDDPLRSVTTVEYNKRDTQSTQWNLHLVQEYVPNELYRTYQNLLCLHLEESRHLPEFKGVTTIKMLAPKLMPKQNGKWFSCASIKSVVQDILKGLEYLSNISYVHRDMKPANLLMTDDGIVKIADFGLSRPKYKPNELLTNNHNVVTRYYRAPEILVEQDKKVSAYGFASDMWSAGAIFAELIYSRPVFEGSSDMTMIFEIIKKCGGISESTWPGISSVLTHDPPANFVKIDPKTKKPRRWEEGEQKFNFFRNLKPEFRNSPRKMSDILKPWIHHSWTAENVRQGLDLLDKMLCYSPEHRITPTEALKHPWFTMSPKPDPKEMKALIARSKTYKRKSRTPQPNAPPNRGGHGHHGPKHGHHGPPNHRRGPPMHIGHGPPHHGPHRNARPLPNHGSHSNHNNNSNNNRHHNNGYNNRQRPNHHGNHSSHGTGHPPSSHSNSHHSRSSYHHRRGGPDHRGYRNQRGGPGGGPRGGRGASGNGMRMNSNPGGNGQRGGGMSTSSRSRKRRRTDSSNHSVSVSSAFSGPKYHGQHGHGHHARNGYHSHSNGQKRSFNQSHSGHYTSSGHPTKKRRMN